MTTGFWALVTCSSSQEQQDEGTDCCPLLWLLGVKVIPVTAMSAVKLQALLYDILPSTTAVFSYTIGSRKLSANEQFLLVLKTTQIKQGVSFIAANKVDTSTNKTTIV